MRRSALSGLVSLLGSALAMAACSSGEPPAPSARAAAPKASASDRYRAVRAAAGAPAASATGRLEPATRASVAALLERDPSAYLIVDEESGRLVHATGRLSEPSRADAEAVWRRFVTEQAALLHLREPLAELTSERAPTEFRGSRFYRLRQLHDGVPVMRRSLKLEIGPDGVVRTLSGITEADVGDAPPMSPSVDGPRARDLAEATLRARTSARDIVRELPPVLMLAPGRDDRPARLLWRTAFLVTEPLGEGVAPHAYLVSVDAHDGSELGVADATSSCTDGTVGSVVTSSETVRVALEGGTPVSRPIETCYSGIFGEYYLEDHRGDAELFCYDGTDYNDPGTAAGWYSSCVEPACFTVSSSSNSWTGATKAFQASDFRNARKVLDLFEDRFGRNGADNAGENLIVVSGVDYDNATAMGIFRAVSFGRPDYPAGKPSYGVLDVAAHEFGHIVSWHEWVGVFDYGFEGSIVGAEGALDEHLSDVMGAIVSHHAADEPWLAAARWAHAAERYYGANYPLRNDASFLTAVTANRNYYRGTDYGVPRAHATQMYIGDWDGGGVHTNAVLLGRATYLFTEGGFVHQDPYGGAIPSWPTDGPTHHVAGIGMEKMEELFYHALVSGSFATPLGTLGYSDITQDEQNYDAMKAQFSRVAYIVHASCLARAAALGWTADVCASVRSAYVGVGLLPPDADDDGLLDVDDNCPTAPNDDQSDVDDDSYGDACDNCPSAANQDQADGDADSVGDVCEAALGTPCTTAAACATNHCVDGVCCDTTCGDGLLDDCLACSEAAGAEEDGTCGNAAAVSCDDTNPCTDEDRCQQGACQGDPVSCPPFNECHTEGSCAPETGICLDGERLADGTPCSVGQCRYGLCEPTDGGSGPGGSGAEGGSGGAWFVPASIDPELDDGGCGCRLYAPAPAPRSGGVGAVGLAAALSVARRRRPRHGG